jgi:hypothetical protein
VRVLHVLKCVEGNAKAYVKSAHVSGNHAHRARPGEITAAKRISGDGAGKMKLRPAERKSKTAKSAEIILAAK